MNEGFGRDGRYSGDFFPVNGNTLKLKRQSKKYQKNTIFRIAFQVSG
jgi:hypothetical protein